MSATLAAGETTLAAIGTTAAGLAAPVAIGVAAIFGIKEAIEHAIENSQYARDKWDEMAATLDSVFGGFVESVGAEWDAWWEKNGETISYVATKVGEFALYVGNEAVQLLSPFVELVGTGMVDGLSALGSVLGMALEGIKMLVAVMAGDATNASRSLQNIWAGLLELLAKLTDGMARFTEIVSFGLSDGGLRDLAGVMRDSAAATRDHANALNEEEAALKKANDAANAKYKQEREAVAELNKASAAGGGTPIGGTDKASGSPARGGRGGNPLGGTSILDQDFGTMQAKEALASMTSGQGKQMLSQMQREIERALTPDENGIISDAKARNILDKYKQVLSQIPGFVESEFGKVSMGIEQAISRAAQNAGNDTIREAAIAGVREASNGSDVFGTAKPTKPTAQAATGGKPQRQSVREQVEALDPSQVGKIYGETLANATRPQAMNLFRDMGHDILKAMRPDADGIIDPKNAETILENYRLVLSKMPGFAAEEFTKVADEIRKQLANATQSGSSELMQNVAKEAIANATGKQSADGVFKEQNIGQQSAANQGPGKQAAR